MRHALKDIGERLTRIRGQQSQAAFAPMVGIHKNTLGTYERGEREAGAGALAGYAALGWNINWVLTGEGPERLEALQDKGSGDDSPQSQDLSLETLKLAVQTVEEARQIVSLSLSPEKAGEVVSLVYQLLCSGLAEAEIIPITRQALKVAKGDAVDAGGSTAAPGSKAAGRNR